MNFLPQWNYAATQLKNITLLSKFSWLPLISATLSYQNCTEIGRSPAKCCSTSSKYRQIFVGRKNSFRMTAALHLSTKLYITLNTDEQPVPKTTFYILVASQHLWVQVRCWSICQKNSQDFSEKLQSFQLSNVLYKWICTCESLISYKKLSATKDRRLFQVVFVNMLNNLN